MAENPTQQQLSAELVKLGGLADRIYRADINFRAKYATKNTEVEIMRQLEPYPKYITNGERSTKYTITESVKEKPLEDPTKIEKPKALYLEVDNSQNWALRNTKQEIIASKEGLDSRQNLNLSPEENRIIDAILNGKELIDAGENLRAANMPPRK